MKELQQTLAERREEEERRALETARRFNKPVTFISSEDGCEVTVTPAGHVFYNSADWW